jgi:hypothetical protein
MAKKTGFDPKKLQTLSSDADDWNQLVRSHDWLNQENSIYGVLLYPRKGMNKDRLDTEMTDWIGSQWCFAQGGLDIIVKQRKDNWAVIYHITSWYNHFELPEQFD